MDVDRYYPHLLAMYVHPLYSHVIRRITNEEDAKDIIQDINERVYRALQSYPAEHILQLQPHRWLCKIMRDACLNYQPSHPPLSSDLSEGNSYSATPDVNTESNEIHNALLSLITSLPQRLRNVVFLDFFNGPSHDKVVKRLRQRGEAIRSHIHHGISQLCNNDPLTILLTRLGMQQNILSPELRAHVDILVAALQNREWSVRVAAVQTLGQLAGQVPIEPLVATLDDEHEAVRAAAVRTLGRLGEQIPVESLVKALEDPAWNVRADAVYALGKLGTRAPLTRLINAMKDKDATVRAIAIQALGEMGEHAPVPALVSALSDPAWLVRESVVLALGKIHERVPRALFQKATLDRDEMVRKAAMIILQQILPDDSSEDILALLATDVDLYYPRLWSQYHDQLYRYASLIVKIREDAKYIILDVSVSVYYALNGYSPERIRNLRLRSWLYTITKNACLNHERKKRGEFSIISIDDTSEGNPCLDIPDTKTKSPEEIVEDHENHDELLSMIYKLLPIYRDPIVLHFYYGYSNGEIAEILQLPEGTVRVHIHRGISQLRRLFRNRLDDKNPDGD